MVIFCSDSQIDGELLSFCTKWTRSTAVANPDVQVDIREENDSCGKDNEVSLRCICMYIVMAY